MAKIEITVPGERIVEEFTALVPQPTVPSTARSPDVGLVELSYVNPTELIPGPPGPPGPRGSRWTTGVGPPISTSGNSLGDMYLDDVDGKIYTWNGTSWIDTGTDLSPNASELLIKIKTVDGEGSGLDADTLDGHDSTYFATDADMNTAQGDIAAIETDLTLKANIASPTFTGDPKAPTPAPGDNDTSLATTQFVTAAITADITPWSEITGKPSTFPPTLPIAQSDVTGLVAGQAAQDTAIALRITDAPSDSLTYGRKNAAWATIVGGAIVSDTPPVGPAPGQMWYEADSGNTYIWYSDADSSQWVQQNIASPVTEMPSGLTAETRNRIVNPCMQISQELAYTGSANTATLNHYTADQWQTLSSTSPGTANTLRVASVTPNGSRDRIRIVVAVAKAALAATDYLMFRQTIEGIRLVDFGYGTASARQSVLRFGFRGPAGTYGITVINNAYDRTYCASFTVTAGQANTDTEQVFIVPGDVTGTWLTDTNVGCRLNVTLAAGTTYQGAPGWQSGNFFGASGQTNGMATAANTFELYDVGLYLDPLNTGVPPRWQMPDEAEELRACRRYWQSNYIFTVETNTTSTHTLYPEAFRIAPAISGGGAGFTAFQNTTLFCHLYQTARAFQTLSFNARM